MAQFYDVFSSKTRQFILRADLRTIGLIWNLHRDAEARIVGNGVVPTELFGVKGGDVITVEPVLSDWQPTAFPSGKIDKGI